jgi:predicted transcriptional regulator
MSKTKVCSHDDNGARVVVSVRVPQALSGQIDAVAEKSQRPRSQIVLWAIEAGIAKAQDNAGVVA